MKPRRILFVTTSRADFGLMRPLIERLRADRRARVMIVASGTHLDGRFGGTESEIRRAGLRVDRRVDLAIGGDSPLEMTRVLSRAVAGFGRAFAFLAPDIIVVLGDRYEILGAAAAALPFRIPVAHIHGGEATEGLIDEQVRHAVTKLSHLHFPVAEPYRRRLLALGEDRRRVFQFGAPGLDDLGSIPYVPRQRLWAELGVPPGREVGVATYHPVTLSRGAADKEASALVSAMAATPWLFWILTLPNADTEHSVVVARLRAFAALPGRAAAHASLGRLRYLSLLKEARIVVGNSSSGLLEAPSFHVPTVDIGDRQKGRLRADSVLHVERPTTESVRRAFARALSPAFRSRACRGRNPYQGHGAVAKIAAVLLRHPLGEDLLRKRLRTP